MKVMKNFLANHVGAEIETILKLSKILCLLNCICLAFFLVFRQQDFKFFVSFVHSFALLCYEKTFLFKIF